MQKTISLNNQYDLFSAGLLKKKDFEVLVFNTIRKEFNNSGFHGMDRDTYDDYISWLYPRLHKAIDKYRETGSSFEAYIGTIVRLTLKEYHSRQARNYVSESVAWEIAFPDMYVYENGPVYDCAVTDKSAEKSDEIDTAQNPRQLLTLVLKCCHFVSEDFLERISARLGMEPEELNNLINQMKEYRLERIKNIDELQGKINSLFCRCLMYEKKLPYMLNETVAQQTRERLKRGRARLAKMREKISHMYPEPSNSQIAQLLGVTKGTVDTSLFNLKKRWKGKDGLSKN